jgi:hypothetical protein
VASCPSPIVSTEGTSNKLTATATDNAGNTTTVTATINLDKTVPTVSSEQAPALLLGGQSLSVSANASDTLSGVLNGEFYIDTDPGQGNGTPMTFANGKITGQTVPQGLSIGTHKVYVRAQDKAGNWSTVSSKSFLFL